MWIRENGHLTRKRSEDSKEYEPEKNKKAPRTANFECPKGCVYIGTKAGPLSQHSHACNGKPWDVQKREKAQTSRSKVQESQSTEKSSSIMTLLGGMANQKNPPYSSSTQ